jgi:predicted DNA-binding protein
MVTKPISLRLDPEIRNRLAKISNRIGLTPSAIMKFAILNQLGEIESGTIQIRRSMGIAAPGRN